MGACSSAVTAEWLKVDISAAGQAKGQAAGFEQWILPINNGSSTTTTIGG